MPTTLRGEEQRVREGGVRGEKRGVWGEVKRERGGVERSRAAIWG